MMPAMDLFHKVSVLPYGISNNVICGTIVFLVVVYALYHVRPRLYVYQKGRLTRYP